MSPSRFVSGCACCPPSLGRRGFLTATAALAATAVAAPAFAQEKPYRIDVHHHLSPPGWVAALKKIKMDSPPVNNWTPEHSLAEMDRGGIATSILSMTQPALDFMGPRDSAATAREANEFAKTLVDKYPGRFGFFAILPMPHVDETLKEIAYAMDVLKADGVGFMTSYGDKWLGHSDFMPVMLELNRRKAVAYTHPNNNSCCLNLAGLPVAAIEYGTDTTRTIGNLIYSGAAAKLPDVEFIFSHGGGTVTSLVERFTVQLPNYPAFPEGKAFTAESVMAQLKRFHYDTAQASNPIILSALTRMVPSSQVLFGTDYPYRTAPEQVRGVREFFSGAALAGVERGNAIKLLPRWA
jgi:predicted TIM-barrel fold metal-dependent hydrolase